VYSYACMTSQFPSPSHWEWVPWKRSLREQTTEEKRGREKEREKKREGEKERKKLKRIRKHPVIPCKGKKVKSTKREDET